MRLQSQERSLTISSAVCIQYTKVEDAGASIPAKAMTQTSPFPSLPPWRSGGIDPSGGGPGGYREEIEIGFGAFCRVFVSKRQLSIVSLFVNKK